MKLDDVRRLSSLTRQLHRHTRHLDSVQRRIAELVEAMHLASADKYLADEVLAAVEMAAATDRVLLQELLERLAAIRHASGLAAVDFEITETETEKE